MRRIARQVLLLAAALAGSGAGAQAQPLTEIKVSYQPALYWACLLYTSDAADE